MLSVGYYLLDTRKYFKTKKIEKHIKTKTFFFLEYSIIKIFFSIGFFVFIHLSLIVKCKYI